LPGRWWLVAYSMRRRATAGARSFADPAPAGRRRRRWRRSPRRRAAAHSRIVALNRKRRLARQKCRVAATLLPWASESAGAGRCGGGRPDHPLGGPDQRRVGREPPAGAGRRGGGRPDHSLGGAGRRQVSREPPAGAGRRGRSRRPGAVTCSPLPRRRIGELAGLAAVALAEAGERTVRRRSRPPRRRACHPLTRLVGRRLARWRVQAPDRPEAADGSTAVSSRRR
jgi:hypothetical protein